MSSLCKQKFSNSLYVPPRIVDRIVQRKRQPLRRNAEPPYPDLIRDDPINFAPRYDLTRARIAYGRLGLPILMRDLEGKDTNKQHAAINSLTDLFHDAEILYSAVEQKIIERLSSFHKNLQSSMKCYCFFELWKLRSRIKLHQLLGSSQLDVEDAVLNALSIACTHYVGSNAVIISEENSKCSEKSTPIDEVEMVKACDSDTPALGRLASMLSSEVHLLRYKAAHVVRNISHCWDGPKGLCENHFIRVLLSGLAKEESEYVEKEILLALKGCLLYDQHEALSVCGMHTLSEFLESKLTEIRTAAADCISALLTNADGKAVANDMDLLKLLLPILFSEDRNESATAAGCVALMTTNTPAKLRAVELDIIERLLFLAGDFHCLQPQLNSIKALTNIAEAPKGREILLQYGVDKIRSIPAQNEEIVERSIHTLIKVIQWKP